MDRDTPSADQPPQKASNRYDRMEWAGAFGDLGILIPFVTAYIGLVGLDPFGVLFAFGTSMVACGLYFRTPFPVQPMKAIGAAASIQAVQTAVVTPASVHVAALATGLIWFVLGTSGLVGRLVRLVPMSVVVGIVMGLGLGFMLKGIQMMQADWLVAVFGLVGTLALMRNRSIPAMLLLLILGAALGAHQNPALLERLVSSSVGIRAPSLALADISWDQVFVGVVLLALPQIPLTLGNAVMAITHENNRLFPHLPVSPGRVAVSTGLMNLFSGVAGGIPMCHGAGGMAAHVAFGARTGGSVVILGSVLLVLALFFSQAIEALFLLFPLAVLGVVLFLTGVQLAFSSRLPRERSGRLIALVCAALCIWNVAAGMLTGLALHHLQRRLPLKI